MNKRIFIVLLVFLIIGNFSPIKSQLPITNFCENYTLNFLDGSEEALYDQLDSGTEVLLYFFQFQDPQAWLYLNDSVLYNIESAFPNQYKVYYIETEANTGIDGVYTFGNLTMNYNALPYNFIETNQFINQFHHNGNQKLFHICPDRTFEEVTIPVTIEQFISEGYACSNPLYNNDIALINTKTESLYCSHYVPSIIVQNLGNEVVDSCSVLLMINGTITDTISILEPLTSYQSRVLEFPFIPDDSLASSLDFILQRLDGVEDENFDNNAVFHYVERAIAGDSLTLILNTDFWPSETHWSIYKEDVLLYQSDSVLVCNTLDTVKMAIPNNGCYRFVVTDDYGDGLVNGAVLSGTHNCTGTDGIADGALKLIGNSGTLLFDNIDYGYGTVIQFWGGIDDITFNNNGISQTTIKIWPNPVNDLLYFNTQINNPIIAEVYSITGQKIISKSLSQNMPLNVTELNPGIYIINIKYDQQIFTKKFIKS